MSLPQGAAVQSLFLFCFGMLVALMVPVGRAAEPDADAGARAAIRAYVEAMAKEDLDAIAAALSGADADEAAMRRVIGELDLALDRFDAALLAAYPDSQAHPLPADPAASATGKLAGEGNRRTLTLGGGRQVVVEQQNGQWRVPVASLLARLPARPVDEHLRRYIEMAVAARELTTEVQAARFPAPAAARQELARRLTDAANGRYAQ
jgi:hypothetical protein